MIVTKIDVTGYRACHMCQHLVSEPDVVGGLPMCGCPKVRGNGGKGQPVRIERARAPGGECGVEAKWLTFPGLDS